MTSREPSRALTTTGDQLTDQSSLQGLSAEQRKAELDRQDLRNRIDNHEKRCEEHYQGIRADVSEIRTDMKEVRALVAAISNAQSASSAAATAVAEAAARANRPKWWMQAIGAATIALIGWMASTIWSMETAKVDALQRQPAASVMVNPSPAPPPIQVAPPTPLLPAPPSDASGP